MEKGVLNIYEARFLGDGTLVSRFEKAKILYKQWEMYKEACKCLDEYLDGCSQNQGARDVSLRVVAVNSWLRMTSPSFSWNLLSCFLLFPTCLTWRVSGN